MTESPVPPADPELHSGASWRRIRRRIRARIRGPTHPPADPYTRTAPEADAGQGDPVDPSRRAPRRQAREAPKPPLG